MAFEVSIEWRRWIASGSAVALGFLLTMTAQSAPSRDLDRQEYATRLGIARTAYFKVITNPDENSDTLAHQALAEFERVYPGDAIGKAYHGSLQLLDAAHSWAIWNLHKQADEGLTLLDAAVAQAPDEPEARFIRAATAWHLPGFYHRKAQCEADFQFLAGRAEKDAREGRLPPELAAATYNYWGQILVERKALVAARVAFQMAVKVAPQSPGGQDAGKRLGQLR